MTKAVTSFDVARLAGVSQATVSRALRNLPSITPATRERVARAAEQLGYVPHESARSLSTRVTSRIAIVSEALTNPFYPELLEPLRWHLGEQGYRVVLVADSEDDALTAATLADGSYDGVIVTTATRQSRLPRTLRERDMPCVVINRITDDELDPWSAFDNRRGSVAIAALLDALGHTRIGLIAGPAEISTAQEREHSFRLELESREHFIPESLIRRVPFSAAAGRAAALDLLSAHPELTALVCGNDFLAFGALNAATATGLIVPDDLTVLGFDDVAMASWDVFSLTTVNCDLDELARRSAEQLIRLIRGLRIDQQQTVGVELVLRGTHGPPRV